MVYCDLFHTQHLGIDIRVRASYRILTLLGWWIGWNIINLLMTTCDITLSKWFYERDGRDGKLISYFKLHYHCIFHKYKHPMCWNSMLCAHLRDQPGLGFPRLVPLLAVLHSSDLTSFICWLYMLMSSWNIRGEMTYDRQQPKWPNRIFLTRYNTNTR